MTELVDVDRALALFAEGIAGRPYHIKSTTERAGDGAVPTALRFGVEAEAGHDRHSLYLPDAVDCLADDGANRALYRVIALDQLGFEAFGTYRFRLAEARRRIAWLAERAEPPPGRDSDYAGFFASFDRPDLARALFGVVETARVRAAVERRYAGVRRYREALRASFADAYRAAAADAQAQHMLTLQAALLSVDGARSPLARIAADVLRPDADVYASAAATVRCMNELGSEAVPLEADARTDHATVLEWLQREARLEDFEEQLGRVEGDIRALEFAVEESEQTRAGEAREAGGELRAESAGLEAERDRLRRRNDMERASVRRALGDNRPQTASFRYDEWDYHRGVYLRGWCRLYEEPLHCAEAPDSRALLDAVRPFAKAVRRRFEEVRPAGFQRVRKTVDGDELDLNAIIEARADIRNSASPDDRVYSRRERLRRDVAAAFLVDLSASTDDIIPEAREAPDPGGPVQDIRDPFFDDDDAEDFAARMAEDAARRRIIDIQREAVLLMATALEGLGDRYGVYGFSGYGRDCVEFFVAKEFDQPFDQGVLDAIAAMKPKRSTRMGPAVRHASAKLDASGAALKVMMIVSDGFPQDHDYGPDRGEHEYGVQDTARALEEAAALGIESFCVTVDRSGHDYLRRMCRADRYMVIEETAELPDALQKAYRRLTRG